MSMRGPRYGSINKNFGENELKKNKGNLLWGLVGAALLSGFIVFTGDLAIFHPSEMMTATNSFNEMIGIMVHAMSQNFLPKFAISLLLTAGIQARAQIAGRRDRSLRI